MLGDGAWPALSIPIHPKGAALGFRFSGILWSQCLSKKIAWLCVWFYVPRAMDVTEIAKRVN